jgi:hypothetical protein
MGLGIQNFTTSYVGGATSIQTVTGGGTSGPDGWAVGTTGGTSTIEIVGNTNTFYVTGSGGLVVTGPASFQTITGGVWTGNPISVSYISGLANVATIGTLASLIDVNVPENQASNTYVLTWNYNSNTWIASPTISATESYGTQGTIQFAGTSNTFSGNNSNLFWNTSTNRLGIGTNSPGSLVDIHGSANIQNQLSVGGALISQSITSNSTIVSGTGLTITTGGFSVTGNSQLTGNLNITGDIIITGNSYISETNVLIVQSPILYVGYSNPGNLYDLGIVGQYITNNTTVYTGLVLNHSNEQWNLFNNLLTQPTDIINWSDTNITPGNLTLGNIIANGNILSTNNTTGTIIITGNGGLGIGGNINAGGQIYTSGNLNISGQSIVNKLTANLASIFNSTLTVNGQLLASNSQSSTTDSNGSLVVTGGIGSSDNVNVGGSRSLFYGSVGVGTSSTTGVDPYRLAVYGPSYFSGLATVVGNISLTNTVSGMSRVTFTDGSYLATANNIGGIVNSYGNVGTIQFAGSSNTFSGDSTNFVWNTSTPGLGIGTATPGSLVDIHGSANIQNQLSVGQKLISNIIVANSSIISNTYQLGQTAISTFTSINITSSGNITPYTIDSFSNTQIRTAHYIVQVTDTTDNFYQSAQIMLLQTGSNVIKTEYNEIYSNTSIGNFNATFSTGNIQLTFLPINNINYSINAVRTAISV